MVQKWPAAQDGEAKRRGRPRAYDPQSALARAADVFWKAGYAGTSLDDLVEATGMNRPSLYAAFGDKRDLYLKTLDHYLQEFRTHARAIVADDPPLRVFFQRFYGKALDIYFADGPRGCYTVGTAATVAAVDDEVRQFLADRVRNADDFLGNRIEKARQRGEIARDADTTALAHLATATLHTLAVRSRAGVPRKQLDQLADGAINVICGASR